MRCSGPILCFTSYKLSTQKIMGKLNWLTAYQLITKETVLFTHKIVFNNQPQSMTNLITFSLHHSQNVRSICKPIIKEEHNPSKAKKSIIFMGIYLYNKLMHDITGKNPKLLSKYLQKISIITMILIDYQNMNLDKLLTPLPTKFQINKLCTIKIFIHLSSPRTQALM